MKETQNPLLFISHKHTDRAVADIVSKFIRIVSGGNVDVYQSSNQEFEGPRFGRGLNHELEQALWRASIVLLIYTSAEQDWSWCMWECGLAIEPNSPDTKVIVLQCLRDDEPKVFESMVRIKAVEESSVIKFAKSFGDQDFFPRFGKAASKLNDNELMSAGKQLYKDLQSTIPKKPRETWNAWPFVRIQLARSIADDIVTGSSEDQQHKVKEALIEHAVILDTASGFPQLFDRIEIPKGMLFGSLFEDWTESYPHLSADWLNVIGKQIINGIKRRSRLIDHWHRFRPVNASTDLEYVTGLGRIKSDASTMEFDLNFIAVAQVPKVYSHMIRIEGMYHVEMANRPSTEIKLITILSDLDQRGWNRLPVLDNQKPRYVIHISMIDRFLRRKTYADESIVDLTLEDFLNDPENVSVCTDIWRTVSESSTAIDAQKLIKQNRNCRDIFVTPTGKPEEAIAGWITDRNITRLISM